MKDPVDQDTSSTDRKGVDDQLENAQVDQTHAGLSGKLEGDSNQPTVEEESILTKKEQRRLNRKIDLHIMPALCLLYFVNLIDRAAVGGAVAHGFRTDLNLVGNDYNIGISIFFIAYAAFDIPSNLLAKKIGAKTYLPILGLCYGTVSFATAFIHNASGFYAVRFLVGMFECGTGPAAIYFCSLFYDPQRLTFRIAIFLAGGPLATAIGPYLANSYVSVGSVTGLVYGWRIIFFGNGIITWGISILAYFMLPHNPEQATWLTDNEKKFIMVRSKRLTAGRYNEEDSKSELVMRALTSPVPYFTQIPAFLSQFFNSGLSFFLAPILADQFHLSANAANARTGAVYFVAFGMSLVVGYLVERTGVFGPWCIFVDCVALIGSCMFIFANDPNARYAGAFLAAAGAQSGTGPQQGWLSANLAPYTTRATGLGLGITVQSMGGLIGAWIFLPAEKATGYPTATKIILTICSLGIMLLIVYELYLTWENNQRAKGKRDHRLEGKTLEEINMLGCIHPSFRYRL